MRFLLALLFPFLASGQTIAHADVHITCAGTSCTTGAGAISAAYTAGNAVMFSLQWTDITVTVTSFSDTGGDTIVPLTKQCMGPSFCSQAFYACNIHADATPQLTVNFSGTGSAGGHVSSLQWTGVVASPSCVDNSTSVQNLNIGPANTDFTITTLATTHPKTVIVNNASCDGCGLPTGWSSEGIDANNTYLYQTETTSGTFNILVRNQFANSNVSAGVIALISAVQPPVSHRVKNIYN